MSEKLMAGVVTAVVIAPICALCVLGPAVLAAFFGGIAGWLGGFDPLVIGGIVALCVVGLIFIRNKRSSKTMPRQSEEIQAPHQTPSTISKAE